MTKVAENSKKPELIGVLRQTKKLMVLLKKRLFVVQHACRCRIMVSSCSLQARDAMPRPAGSNAAGN